MALMLLESFQKYSLTQDERTQLSRYGWGVVGTGVTNVVYDLFIPTTGSGASFFSPISNFGRSGKPALGITGLNNAIYLSYGGQNSQGLSFDDEVSIGFSLYNVIPGGDPASYLGSDDNHFEIHDANNISSMMQVSVGQFRSNNSMYIKYNNGASVSVIPNAQTYNMSTYYEVAVKLSTGSDGVIKVRRNGTEISNISGVQTANSWYSGSIGFVRLGFPSRTHGLSVSKVLSDIYIKNDLDLLGELRIDALFPSANGTNTGFSANGSQSNHWENVDEIYPDDNVTYNYAETGSNLNEDYTIQSLPTSPNINTIFAIQVTDTVRKSDVGSASVKSYLYNKVSNTYSYFPTIDGSTNPPLSTSFTTNRFVANTDPFTSILWTKESLANVQFGYNVP